MRFHATVRFSENMLTTSLFLIFCFVFCCHKYLWIVFSAWRFYIVRLKTMYTVAYIQLDRSQKVIAIAFGFVSFWWYWKWLFMWRGEEIITLKALSRRQLVLPSYITLAIGQDPRGAPFLPEDWCPRTGSLLVRLGRGSSAVRSLNAAPRWSSDVLTLFGFAPVWKARQRKRRTRFPAWPSERPRGSASGTSAPATLSRGVSDSAARARGVIDAPPSPKCLQPLLICIISPLPPFWKQETDKWFWSSHLPVPLRLTAALAGKKCSPPFFIFCLRLFVYCLFNATVLHFHI